MKRRGIAIALSLCLLLSACGRTQQDAAGTERTEGTDSHSAAEQESAASSEASLTDGTVRIIERNMPDADEALQEYLPENGGYRELLWDMSGDTVYRFVELLAQKGWTEGYCLQRLASPYEEWECQAIGLTDWTGDGTQCCVAQASFDGDGNLQLLISFPPMGRRISAIRLPLPAFRLQRVPERSYWGLRMRDIPSAMCMRGTSGTTAR